jgi:N,N'-diacetyllegionaminate synthase
MYANKVLIIAEAGVNHNGNFELARKLIDVAASSGADYVKFQTFKADKIANKTANKAEYQLKNIADGDNSQYAMLKKLEMPEQWHYELDKYALEKGIHFLSSGFDEDSIDFLDKMGTPLFKIPSGEITNKPYLAHISKKNKPVILSTGMANLDEIKMALSVLMAEGLSKEMITVLHCNTEYPTPMIDVNLLAMITIQKEFGICVGYSDHTLGIEVPIAAVALGAVVIEKHFTLDRTLPGPDHKASLEPDELIAMVKAIRNIELAISGDGKKEPSASEEKNKAIVRKSLHFNKSIKAGHTITAADLIALRPGDGINPMDINIILGKVLTADVESFELLSTKKIS